MNSLCCYMLFLDLLLYTTIVSRTFGNIFWIQLEAARVHICCLCADHDFLSFCIFYVYVKRGGKQIRARHEHLWIYIHIAKCANGADPSSAMQLWHEDGNNFMERGSDCHLNAGQFPYILMALSTLYIYNTEGFAGITAARRCHRHINLTLLSEDFDSCGLADTMSNRGCTYGGK